MNAQELQGRALLAQQVQQRHRPGSRDALLRERDLASLPHGSPGVCVEAAADRCEALALDGRTFRRSQQIADVAAHCFDDPEARQQLEVDAHAEQPPRFGQEPLLVDDVGDEGTRVQGRLFHPDQQHGEPRVVRVAGARETGRGGLARDIWAHDSFEHAAVQGPEQPDIGDVQPRLGRGDSMIAVDQTQLDAELLQEQVAEPVGIVVAGGVDEVGLRVERKHEARVGRLRCAERPAAVRVEALQIDRPPVPFRQLDRGSGSVVPGQRQRHVDSHPLAPLRQGVEDVDTVGAVVTAEHQRRVVARAEAGMAPVVGRTASAHERHDLDRGRSRFPLQFAADPVADLRVARSMSRRVGNRGPSSIVGAGLIQDASRRVVSSERCASTAPS